MPSVRDDARLPAEWHPSVPAAVVGGAALVAAGTVAEFVLKRVARGILGRAARPQPDSLAPANGVLSPEAAMPDDADIVTETFLLRRVRIRR